jgi:hypothetical protein
MEPLIDERKSPGVRLDSPDGATQEEHPDTEYWKAGREAGSNPKDRCEEEGRVER